MKTSEAPQPEPHVTTDALIAPAVDDDQAEVRALILSIQARELGGADNDREIADLRLITKTYWHGAGGFWVARQGNRIVGTVALKDIGGGNVFLKRMYVDAGFRGPGGISAPLLDTALAWARAHGAVVAYLGTTADPPAAPRFYRKHGFDPVDRAMLPPGAVVAEVDDCFFRRPLV